MSKVTQHADCSIVLHLSQVFHIKRYLMLRNFVSSIEITGKLIAIQTSCIFSVCSNTTPVLLWHW